MTSSNGANFFEHLKSVEKVSPYDQTISRFTVSQIVLYSIIFLKPAIIQPYRLGHRSSNA